MKLKTREKYIDFLRYSYTASGIYDLNLASRHYKVADAFISFLKKNKYLERMAGGSYKLIDCPLGFGHIVNEYKKATEKKQPPVKDFCDCVSEAYPHVTNTGQMSDKLTTEQREKAAIDILGSIMRDNAGVTYKVTRIENKETILL